ncbi:7-dehydrocholesterol reductase [Zea mays]|nr:7-dehydrocholesterol reductase [Zea mays]
MGNARSGARLHLRLEYLRYNRFQINWLYSHTRTTLMKKFQIVASYQTTKGETKTSLLLTSGWWGLSRHFHYVPEILSAFFWTVPALFNHFLPYFYVIFLTILLFDRAKRDDDRCSSKYGKYWKIYCNKVPYRVIPGIY